MLYKQEKLQGLVKPIEMSYNEVINLLRYTRVKKTNFMLYVLSLFRHSTSTCFGHICIPSSGSILYIYNNWYVLCCSLDCLLAG